MRKFEDLVTKIKKVSKEDLDLVSTHLLSRPSHPASLTAPTLLPRSPTT